jgi:hypothetical protein
MAGYYIYSLDAKKFEQLTTSPTIEQCRILASPLVDDLEDMIVEYEDEADPKKWPLDLDDFTESIRKRLVSQDWYADFNYGDAAVWGTIIWQLTDEPGEKLGVDFRCDNDGFLYWNAAKLAAKHGAPMMTEPKFGGSGFRYSGKSRGDIDLNYTFYLPPQVQQLLKQLEKAVPHFETLPEDEDGDRDQFFRGLLEPVRTLAAEGRVMWVQTDT